MRTVKGTFGLAVALSVILTAGAAHAQSNDTPRVEIGVLPGGVTYFTKGDSGAPSFATYALAGSAIVNINRFVGIEGEFGTNLGIDQDLIFRAPVGTKSVQPPHTLTYSGNVIAYLGGRGRRVVPYATGGAGGLTLIDRVEVGVPETTTLFAGNAGGGVLFAVNDRLSVRGDYRFVAVASKDDAPVFSGIENRYGHRVAGGVVIRAGR